MQKQAFIYSETCSSRFLMHEPEAEVFILRVKFNFKFQVVSFYAIAGIARRLSLTSGTAQRSGHSSVHDEQCALQPRAMHGHLYLLDARVQSSLPGLLPGEDGAALAADLSGRRANSHCSRCEAWRGRKMDSETRDAGGTAEDYGTVLLMSYSNCFIIVVFHSFTNFTCQRPEEHNTACDNSCIISYMALEKICEV